MRGIVSAIWMASVLGWGCAGAGGDEDAPRPALVIQGSLSANASSLDGKNVPALLYSDGVSRLWLQELEAHGAFPDELDVELWQPPPEEALVSVGHLGEPKIAVAYLTAVADLQPDHLRFTSTWTRATSCGTDCEVEARWCAGDFVCYSEELTCPEHDTPLELCELQSSRGDPELKQPAPWDRLAGVSTNYVIVYVSEALPASSVTATLLAAPKGLEAGYHVLALSDLWDSEDSKRRSCWNDAIDDALTQLDVRADSPLHWYDVMRPCADENSWTRIDSPVCTLPQLEREALRAQLEALTWRASFERGCLLTFRGLQPIAANAPLEFQLSSAGTPALVQLF